MTSSHAEISRRSAAENPRLSWPRCVALVLIYVVWNCSTSPADEPLVQQLNEQVSVELKLSPAPHFVVRGLEVTDLSKAADVISFSVHTSAIMQPPAMLGRYRQGEEGIEFHPRFPLSQNTIYTLNFASSSIADAPLFFSLPTPAAVPAPTVAAIYPTAAALPENLLKFYVYFDQPMTRGEAYKRIRLFEGDREIDEPFLELGEELWDSQQTRFTLFLHPGRIKRGVQPRELRGPPLTAGKDYALRIDAGWASAAGEPLAAVVEKKFTVSAPQHAQLDPLHWKIDTPAVGTREPVTLTFDRPLDRAMLERVLEVKYNDDSTIAGEIEVREDETQWLLTPTEPWKVGAYNVEVMTHLEDLCGNSIAAPFEVKMNLGATETPAAKISIAFLVK